MAKKIAASGERDIMIRLPVNTYLNIAACCYECCGHTSPAAIGRMAALFLHHAWHEMEAEQRWPYWMSTIFDEINDLSDQ